MAEPTEYDLVQDQEIDGLKEIVTTTYQEPDQSEYSYPVVDQPMNDEQWQYVTLSNGDGVLDTGGSPYNLKLNGSEANTNSTNTMMLAVSTISGTAQAVLRGFYHRLLENMVLSIPGVTSNTIYYVVLEYDPTKGKTANGPISVQVVTSLNYSSGRHYLVLWKVTRKPNQLLTDATIEKYTPRVVPTQLVYSMDELPDPSKCLWGALYVVQNTADIVMAVGANKDSAGPSEWRSILSPAWEETPDGSSYVHTGSGYRVAIKRQGNTRSLRGQWKRKSGQNFYPDSPYLLYQLSVGDRPKATMRFKTAGPGTANGGTTVTVTVATNGEVTATPSAEAAWMSLDGVQFDVE